MIERPASGRQVLLAVVLAAVVGALGAGIIQALMHESSLLRWALLTSVPLIPFVIFAGVLSGLVAGFLALLVWRVLDARATAFRVRRLIVAAVGAVVAGIMIMVSAPLALLVPSWWWGMLLAIVVSAAAWWAQRPRVVAVDNWAD